MFYKTFSIYLLIKFFWLGLILGVFKIFCNSICKLTNKNIFIVNLIGFCFWSIFSMIYLSMCINYYNYQFCWFGFIATLVGINFIKITIENCFTNIFKLLYNKIDRKKRGMNNGKLRSDEKG